MHEVFTPDNDGQLVELIQSGLANGSRFSIQGHNTKAGFGYEQETEAGISTTCLNGILDYEPAELVMRAKAGTPLADIEDALSQHDQHLAFEPAKLGRLYDSEAANGTIGAVFMANLSGPRRFVAGAARDHILGVRAVSGRGEVYKSGGNVIKNVTGYDLSKLLSGSWGTLSVVTELTFKVLPKPQYSMSLGVAEIDPASGLAILSKVAQSPLQTSGLAYLPQSSLKELPEQLCLIRLEGSHISVQERLKGLKQLLPENLSLIEYDQEQSQTIWKAIGNTSILNTDQVVLKISIPPASAPDLIKEIPSAFNYDWYADAAGAWLWLALSEDNAVDNIKWLRRQIAEQGGSAVLYKATEEIKRPAGIHSALTAGLSALTQRIKNSFDPNNILNPERLFIHQ
jgi:glycolate dehydrogenase FAD-binding subunit